VAFYAEAAKSRYYKRRAQTGKEGWILVWARSRPLTENRMSAVITSLITLEGTSLISLAMEHVGNLNPRTAYAVINNVITDRKFPCARSDRIRTRPDPWMDTQKGEYFVKLSEPSVGVLNAVAGNVAPNIGQIATCLTRNGKSRH
jgi:hypothetical protein